MFGSLLVGAYTSLAMMNYYHLLLVSSCACAWLGSLINRMTETVSMALTRMPSKQNGAMVLKLRRNIQENISVLETRYTNDR